MSHTIARAGAPALTSTSMLGTTAGGTRETLPSARRRIIRPSLASVTLDAVAVDYPGAPGAVNRASLDVDAGSIVALLGPSGCGKTSLLRSIAGLERPVTGTVSIGDSVVSSPSTWVKPERRSVGMVFQDGALFPHLSVHENIAFGLKSAGVRVGRSERATRVDQLLTLVDLDGLGDRLPDTLSGGQQQRVALARSLAPNPSVLLLDEPFSALDAGLRVQVRADVAKILREVGVTSIFVTHDQDEAFVLGDHVAVMRNGAIEQMASPDELYRSPVSRWVAGFVGEANFVAGTPTDDGRRVDTTLGSVSVDHVVIDPPSDVASDPLSERASDPLSERASDPLIERASQNVSELIGHDDVAVLVRPEQVEISTGDDANITNVEYYGHDVRYELLLDDGTVLAARTHPDQLFSRGERVALSFEPNTSTTVFRS